MITVKKSFDAKIWRMFFGRIKSNQPPTHFAVQSIRCNTETEGDAVQAGAMQLGVVLWDAVRDNDPWLCKPLVSKWLCWNSCIPDACCLFDKYAVHKCPRNVYQLSAVDRDALVHYVPQNLVFTILYTDFIHIRRDIYHVPASLTHIWIL